MRLLIRSAARVVVITSKDVETLTGSSMRQIEVLENDIAIAVDDQGIIAAIGRTNEVRSRWKDHEFKEIIDATGQCVIPGLIDAHTHPVWAGDRVHEFAMKLAGASYLEIHEAGAGIYFTVEKTRETSEEELFESLKERLLKMLRAGTTTVEVKSGYGLDLEGELILLRVLERARQCLPIELSITYCGAHAVPIGKTSSQATEDIIQKQIPTIKSLIEKGILSIENIDVFCEEGVFNVEQSKIILTAGKAIGLNINFHGDELNPMKSAEMGAQLGAVAISHLEEVTKEGIKAMGTSGTIAVLLPTTAYIMKLKAPPARDFIEEGVPIALGSDFNPNAHCFAMPLVMNYACIKFGISMEEALVAATLNAAASLGRGKTHGAIQVGRVGDFVILNNQKWEHLIYQIGSHQDLIEYVVKRGEIVYKKATED
ncbi:putative imidazolonepropionase [Blattella germanica]|nr:putative imidazolonepropionase [Blattella germanica]